MVERAGRLIGADADRPKFSQVADGALSSSGDDIKICKILLGHQQLINTHHVQQQNWV